MVLPLAGVPGSPQSLTNKKISFSYIKLNGLAVPVHLHTHVGNVWDQVPVLRHSL